MKVKTKNKEYYVGYGWNGIKAEYNYVNEYPDGTSRIINHLFIIHNLNNLDHNHKFNKKVKRISKLFLDDDFKYINEQYLCFESKDIIEHTEDIIKYIKTSRDLFARVIIVEKK